MNIQHRDLAAGRWRSLSFVEQLANVGSEVERTMNWRQKQNADYSLLALDRALELLDLTIADPRHSRRLRELTRLRETLVDYFLGDNQYASSDRSWRACFNAFGYAAALTRRPSDKNRTY